LIPELARHGLQQLIELEVAAVLGADRHERTEERCGYRKGSRPRLLTTQVGDIPLAIPKLRAASFFPTILEPRRRIDQALYSVIMEAWVKGVSTRKVDALVAAIGSDAGNQVSARYSGPNPFGGTIERVLIEVDKKPTNPLEIQRFLDRMGMTV
jgi:transposase-like protein